MLFLLVREKAVSVPVIIVLACLVLVVLLILVYVYYQFFLKPKPSDDSNSPKGAFTLPYTQHKIPVLSVMLRFVCRKKR